MNAAKSEGSVGAVASIGGRTSDASARPADRVEIADPATIVDAAAPMRRSALRFRPSDCDRCDASSRLASALIARIPMQRRLDAGKIASDAYTLSSKDDRISQNWRSEPEPRSQ